MHTIKDQIGSNNDCVTDCSNWINRFRLCFLYHIFLMHFIKGLAGITFIYCTQSSSQQVGFRFTKCHPAVWWCNRSAIQWINRCTKLYQRTSALLLASMSNFFDCKRLQMQCRVHPTAVFCTCIVQQHIPLVSAGIINSKKKKKIQENE